MAMTLSRKILVLVAAMLVGLVAVVAVVPAQADQATQTAVYDGTSTMTVQLTNVMGQQTSVETYTNPIEVVLREPSPYTNDTNQFYLSAQSKPVVNDPGEVEIMSVAPVGTDVNGNKILLRMWKLQVPTGGTFNGTLTDNHFNEGASFANEIDIPIEVAPNITQVMPEPMANGTQMSGTVTNNDNDFRAQIQGNTHDQEHPFRLTIEATRVG